jgi:HEAT repeat protein
LLESEHEIRPLSSAIFALAHLGNPQAIPAICGYVAHQDAEVRYASAFALGCVPNCAKAIEGLIELTRDVDGDVRDWATFGVGVLGDADSVQIRDALAARLCDTHQDAREEAVVALAKRHDGRVLPPLFEMLRQPEPSTRIFEAASLMLGMEQDEPEMKALEYITALEKRLS